MQVLHPSLPQSLYNTLRQGYNAHQPPHYQLPFQSTLLPVIKWDGFHHKVKQISSKQIYFIIWIKI